MSLYLQQLIRELNDVNYNTEAHQLLSGHISGIDIILTYVYKHCDTPKSDEPYNPLSTIPYVTVLDIFEYADKNAKTVLSYPNDLTYMILAMHNYLSLDKKLKKYEPLFNQIGTSVYGSIERYQELLGVAQALGSVEYFDYWKSNDPALKKEIGSIELPFEV